MTIRIDIEAKITEKHVTKIDGQPTLENIRTLDQELAAILSEIETTNGGGNHGHLGMIMNDTDYQRISTGRTKWTVPTNPGSYPSGIDDTTPTHERERLVAEHKVKVEEFETYRGVLAGTKTLIIQAVDEEWIEPLRDARLGFANVTPLELLEHLTLIAGELDYFDETECLNTLLVPWEPTENPATYFARNDKIEKQLKEAGYGDKSKERLAVALTSFKSAGEYDAALREWDQKSAADKTFKNFRKIIVDEFTKHERRNKSTAKSVKFGIANQAAEEARLKEAEDADAAAYAIAEALHTAQQKQYEAMQAAQNKQNENMMEMFKMMMQSMGTNAPLPTPTPPNPNNRQRRDKCPSCGFRHAKPQDCWELEANKSKRPANWKPAAERLAAIRAANAKKDT
jgi:hypothetical protein